MIRPPLAAPALAQQAPPAGEFLTQAPGALRISEIRGLGVIGLDHVKVGSIEDVVLGPDGRATAVVIGVGGFLGIGEKKVALPFDQVVWNTKAKPTDGPRGSTAPNQAGARADRPGHHRQHAAGPGDGAGRRRRARRG